jgi:hypothetical protein
MNGCGQPAVWIQENTELRRRPHTTGARNAVREREAGLSKEHNENWTSIADAINFPL